jgi:hypothetical protein
MRHLSQWRAELGVREQAVKTLITDLESRLSDLQAAADKREGMIDDLCDGSRH